MPDLVDDFDPQLDERIAELRTILSLVQLSAPVLVQTSIHLIDLLRQRADRDDDDSAVNEALQVAEHALGLITADEDDRRAVLVEQALTLEHRFDRQRDPIDLDRAISIWRALATPGSAPSTSVAVATAQLGCLLRLRLGVLVDTADDDTVAAALTEALQTLQLARESLPEDAPNLAETCWLLGLCWCDRYEIDRDIDQLNRAISEIADSLRLAPDSTGDRSLAFAKALHERAAVAWVATGHQVTPEIQSDLAQATAAVFLALELTGTDESLHEEVLWEAVAIGVTQLDLSPDAVDLTQLMELTDRLDAHYDAIDPQRRTDGAQATLAIRARIAAAMAAPDPARIPPVASGTLQEFMRLLGGRLAADGSFTVPPDLTNHPRLAMMLRPDLLKERFDEVLRAWRDSPPGPLRAEAGGLAVVLQLTLRQRGLIEYDASTAIAMATEALTCRTEDATWQTQIALVLAALLTEHATVAEPAQVVQALSVLERLAIDDPAVAQQVLALRTTALQVRAAHSGELTDLDAALAGTEAVLAATPAEDELHLSVRCQLGGLLVAIGHAHSDEATLRRGVSVLRQCAEELPGQDTRRATVLTNLAKGEAALLRSDPASPDDVARLAELIQAAEAAPGRSAAVGQQIALLRTLLPLFAGEVGRLDDTVEQLASQAPTMGARALLLHRMAVGVGHAAIAEATRNAARAAEAVREFEAVRDGLAGDIRDPLFAEAAFALGRAYRIRADLAPPGIDRSEDRERSRAQGMLALRGYAWRALVQGNSANAVAGAKDAAATALEVAGWCVTDRTAADAAAALDAGRGLVLHAASVTPQFGAIATDPQSVAADPRSRRLWALLGESDGRSSPLLDPPLLADIQRALRSQRAQALVYLLGRDDEIAPVAVIVPATGEASIVDLPTGGTAPPEYFSAMAANDHRAPRDADVAGTRPTEALRLHDVLPGVAHWAWQAAMGRVLDHCQRSGFTRPYRLVLVPMGQLAAVPWHAARSPAGRYAIEDAVLSYAASARLLCDVAARPRIPVELGGLIVGDPTGDLPAAGEEASAIRDRFYPGARYLGSRRSQSPATPTELLNWLASTVDEAQGVLHLACHATVETHAANSSTLILADAVPLSAEELVENAAWKAGSCQLGLACLAACSTGMAGRGYDEAFSLATAFQVVGARSVISSLWRVPDQETSLLMYLLHHYLIDDRVRPADALRLAQLWMLDPDRRIPRHLPEALAARLSRLDPTRLATWAGFVHLGQW